MRRLSRRVDLTTVRVASDICGSSSDNVALWLLDLVPRARIITNDISPTVDATFHLDATEAASLQTIAAHAGSPISELIVTSPPYSSFSAIIPNAFAACSGVVALKLGLNVLDPTKNTQLCHMPAWQRSEPTCK
jgi:hypothetical protein